MPSLLQMKSLAEARFAEELFGNYSPLLAQEILDFSFSGVSAYVDCESRRDLLSEEQVARLVELGDIEPLPPEDAHAVKVRGVAECIWRLADPSCFEGSDHPGTARLFWSPDNELGPGRMVFHAIVVGELGEVLVQWFLAGSVGKLCP